MITKAEIKLVRSLSDKQGRADSGLFAIEGFKMVSEATASGAPICKVFLTRPSDQARDPGMATLSRDIVLRGIALEEVSPAEMERISHLKTPPGILALIRIPARGGDMALREGDLILALDGVQDPGNMGTIIRIADWFGIDRIICSEGSADCYNPKVVQATMGALFRVAVHYADLPALLMETAGAMPIYGTTLDGDNIYETELTPGGIIVLGSESHGISSALRPLLTRKLLIPPYPAHRHGSESLNVATATAITCSEFRRRTKM